MSVSHCMHHALAIAAKPRAQWQEQIAKLPDGCGHTDCGAPHSCRERVADYLRVQWRMQVRREARPA